MTIVYITEQIYLHGGVEKVLSQKANYLANLDGYQIIIITHNQQGRKTVYSFDEKIQLVDLDINYEIGKSYFHFNNLKKIPKHFNKLKTTIDLIKPDIIISSSPGPDFYFLPFIEKNTPKIKEYHGSKYFIIKRHEDFKFKLKRKFVSFIDEKFDQIIVLNEEEKKFYYSNNINVIPNPVEITSQQISAIPKRILAAGRISPVKNFEALIDAFAQISSNYPEWELHFWGEDYIGTKDILINHVNKLGLKNQVKFMGITRDLKGEMNNYSIYGMTSETECFPMVLLEALSVGMPIVTFDCPTGPRHIVTSNEDSFLVSNKDVNEFAMKLSMLMNDESLRKGMGRNGIKNVKRFEIETVMEKWISLFQHLVIVKKN